MSDAIPKPSIDSALRNINYGFIEEQALIAQSLWKSIEEAAFRGDPMAVGVHLRQARLLTFAVVQTLEETLKIGRKEAA